MEIQYTGDGFSIVHDGKTLFTQAGPTDGGTWTQAEKEAVAQEYYDNALYSYVKDPMIKLVDRVYEIIKTKPFTDSNGRQWVRTFTSALRLDGARRSAIEAGLTTVRFRDVNRDAHDLTIEDATQTVLELSGALQATFDAMNNLINDIKAAPDEAALGQIDIYGTLGVDPNDPTLI